ncbi:hypothetical protein D3C77_283040 [compost metagenome]
MLHAIVVLVVGMVRAEHHPPGRQHVTGLTRQGHVQPGLRRQCRQLHLHGLLEHDTHAFDIRGTGLELVQTEAALHLQAAVQEAGPPEDVAVAQALALVDTVQAHGEVVLPGTGVYRQSGECGSTVELDQEVAGDVVADLMRRDVHALLLHGHIGHGQQNILDGFQADPVEVPIANVGPDHQAVNHLTRIHVALAVDVGGVDDLSRRRLASSTIDSRIRVQAGDVGQYEAGDLQDLLVRVFLGDQVFAGKGNASAHGCSWLSRSKWS